MESLFCIPSQSSCISYSALDRTVTDFFRSESSPINADHYRNKVLNKSDLNTFKMSNQSAERFRSPLNDDSAFVRDAKSCPEGCIEENGTTSSNSSSALFVTKRSHNFQVGLEMHEESVRSKRCSIVQGRQDATGRMQIHLHRLPSAELWEVLLQ